MNRRNLRDLSSPESIASALVAVLAVVLIGSQALAARGGDPTTPIESGAPSAIASALPTMDPAIRKALATALVINQSLASRSVSLQAAIAVKNPLAPDIAVHLRLVNSDLTAGIQAADRLLLAPEMAKLGSDLGAFYQGILDRNNLTLGTTIRNNAAYVAGAAAVIKLLEPLPAFNDRIADMLAGRSVASPSPSSRPSPSTPPSPTPPPTPSPPPVTAPPPSPTPPPSGSPGASVAPSLVQNPGFEDGLNHWQLELTDGAQATITPEAGAGPDGSTAARVDISVGSQARSGIALVASRIGLSQGATYTIDVWVKASAAREVRVRLTDGAGQITAARVFQVTTMWTVVSFQANQLVADPAVQLGLDLGRSDATVWFDNVVIRESPG